MQQVLTAEDFERSGLKKGQTVMFPITSLFRSGGQSKERIEWQSGSVVEVTRTGAVIKGITVPSTYNRSLSEIVVKEGGRTCIKADGVIECRDARGEVTAVIV